MHGIEIVIQNDSVIFIEADEPEYFCRGADYDYLNDKGCYSENECAMPGALVASIASRARTGWNRVKFGRESEMVDDNRSLGPFRHEGKTNKSHIHVAELGPPAAKYTDEEHGGSADSEYSRRLVEYFVVVSSVPRSIRKSTSSERNNSHSFRSNSASARADFNSESHNHVDGAAKQNSAAAANRPMTPPSPPGKFDQLSPRLAARVDSRWIHLSKEWVGVGEAPVPVTGGLRLHEQVDNSTPSDFGDIIRTVYDQKKKLSLHAAEMQQHLETKLKSVSSALSNSQNQGSKQTLRNPPDADDDSSGSSFSNDKYPPANIYSPSTPFQPSPLFPRPSKCKIPPPSPSLQSRGGATENIRIDDLHVLNTSKEYNDDIDDCILEPVITAQYPPVDRPDHPLNPMLTHFCHPQGVENIVPLHEYKMPKIHHFVLTDSAGGKLYGTCLTVYEEFSSRAAADGVNPMNEDHDEISLPSVREDGQERNYVECNMNGSPKVKRHRRRSKNHTYYAPRVLCLLSRWPYLSAFRTYLTQLYRLATTTTIMSVPLERFILNICEEVPAPPPGSFEVQLSILETNIRIWAPPADQPIPYVSVQYGVLFECLDIGNVLFAWYTLACERKILLVSSQLSLLTVCAEILCSMIFPMRWSHLYIPVVPKLLTPILDAPMPYLCGISREILPRAIGDISDETVVVDLDRNLITMGSRTPDLPILPERRKMKMEAALERHAGEVFWKARGLTRADVERVRTSGDECALIDMLGRADGVWDEKLRVMDEAYYLANSPDSMSVKYDRDDITTDTVLKQSRWDAVQETFLRFYVAMLKDYRKYLPPTLTDQKSWRSCMHSDARFMANNFLASQRLDFQPFLEELVSSQQFDDFITKRMYNAGKAPDVTFFDQSIDAKKNRSKLQLKKLETPFLHNANAHRKMKRIDAIQPNRQSLPTTRTIEDSIEVDNVGNYTYPTWPESFDETLFGNPRPIPKIITAEFDRRAALAAMFKEKRSVVEESRLSGSANPSPEVTSFVLFFVMFSQIIGREWESFKKQHENMLDEENYFDGTVKEADSGVSSGPWKPQVNPPWMAGESFQCLHSNFRPRDGNEHIVHERDYDSAFGTCCIPDCDKFCNDVANAIDSSPYLGVPWAPMSTYMDKSCCSPIDEQFESEMTKARSVAKAEVDLGLNTLKMLRLRRLTSETIMYKSLIEACARCGISHRATQLLQMMIQDGLIVDSEVYYCFMKAFSQRDTETTISSHPTADTTSEISTFLTRPASVDGYHRRQSLGEDNASIGTKLRRQSAQWLDGMNIAMTSSLNEDRKASKLSKMKRLKNIFDHSLTKEKNLIVTKAVKTHLDLSNCILEDLYPGLVIDTDSDTCPKCSCVLCQDNIISGWKPCEVKDFSTKCPSCKHRFVPKFSVSCSSESFVGSQGRGTTFFVDYLSPWILLRQVRNLIDNPSQNMGSKAAKILGLEESDDHGVLGVKGIIDPTFRDGDGINATLWWNIIVTFKRFKIPYTFLLQGSYTNQQLIMPTLDDI